MRACACKVDEDLTRLVTVFTRSEPRGGVVVFSRRFLAQPRALGRQQWACVGAAMHEQLILVVQKIDLSYHLDYVTSSDHLTICTLTLNTQSKRCEVQQ